MLRRNKNIKLGNSARIIKGEKKKELLKRDKLDKLAAQIDSMPYGEKREDAKMALECLLSGKKVVLQMDGKISLYFERIGTCRMEESYAIENNQELYTLLEDLVQS